MRSSGEKKSESLTALDTTLNSSRVASLVNSTHIVTNNLGSCTSLTDGRDKQKHPSVMRPSDLCQVQLGQLVIVSSKSLEEPETRTHSQRNLHIPASPTRHARQPQRSETIATPQHQAAQGLGYILECESNLEVSQAAEECGSRTIKKSSCSRQLPSSGIGRKSNFKPMLPVFDEDSRHESFDSSFSENESSADGGEANIDFGSNHGEFGSPHKLGHSNKKVGVDKEALGSSASKSKNLLALGKETLMRKPSKDRWLAASPLNDKSISSEASMHSKRRSMALKMNQDLTFEKCRLQVNESIY